MVCQSYQQAKTSNEHHITIWNGEIGPKLGAFHHIPPWASDGDAKIVFWKAQRFRVEDQGTMTVVVKYLLVSQTVSGKSLYQGLQLWQVDQAGVVLEYPLDSGWSKAKSKGVEISEIED
jgi:hypothetical protein